MLSKTQERIVIFLGILGAVTLFFLPFSSPYESNLDFEFTLTKQEIIEKADDFLLSQGIPVDSYSKNVNVFSQGEKIVFLLKNFSRKRVSSYVKSIPLYNWFLIYRRSGSKKDTNEKLPSLVRISLNPLNGAIVGYENSLVEEQKEHDKPGRVDFKDARIIAEKLLESAKFDLSSFAIKESAPKEEEHIFEWQKRLDGFSDVYYKVVIEIANNKVSSFKYGLDIPKQKATVIEFIDTSLFIVLNLLIFGMAVFIIVIAIINRKVFEWRKSLPFVFLTLIFCSYRFIGVTSVKGNFLLVKLGFYILLTVLSMLWISMVYSSSLYYAKRSKLNPFSVDGSSAILLSYIFVFVCLGVVLVWNNLLIKAFNPVSMLGIYQVFSRFPQIKFYAIFAPLLALSAAVSEELFFRFFLFSFLKKYIKRVNLLIIVVSLIWSFVHVTPLGLTEVYPGYFKGFIVLPVGILLGILFVKFGLISAITTHYLYNNVIIGMALFEFNRFKYHNENTFILMLSCIIPLIVVFFIKKRNAVKY